MVWNAWRHIERGQSQLRTRGHICLIPSLASRWVYVESGEAAQTYSLFLQLVWQEALGEDTLYDILNRTRDNGCLSDDRAHSRPNKSYLRHFEANGNLTTINALLRNEDCEWNTSKLAYRQFVRGAQFLPMRMGFQDGEWRRAFQQDHCPLWHPTRCEEVDLMRYRAVLSANETRI